MVFLAFLCFYTLYELVNSKWGKEKNRMNLLCAYYFCTWRCLQELPCLSLFILPASIHRRQIDIQVRVSGEWLRPYMFTQGLDTLDRRCICVLVLNVRRYIVRKWSDLFSWPWLGVCFARSRTSLIFVLFSLIWFWFFFISPRPAFFFCSAHCCCVRMNRWCIRKRGTTKACSTICRCTIQA